MRTLKLVVSYDGTHYHGFQKQKNYITVQNVLEEVLSKFCGEPVKLAGSGRTDAGVHALGQTISLKTNGSIPCANLVRASRRMLPPDIVIISAEEVEADFHARISAQWKRYLYRIIIDDYNSPFEVNYAWQLQTPLNVAAMNEAAQLLLGKHNFSAFRSSGSVDSSPWKTIYEAYWEVRGKELYFYIAGDGFLYHMVRNLVWALVQIGLGKREGATLEEELAGERCLFMNSPAPAQGLYLDAVYYSPYFPLKKDVKNLTK